MDDGPMATNRILSDAAIATDRGTAGHRQPRDRWIEIVFQPRIPSLEYLGAPTRLSRLQSSNPKYGKNPQSNELLDNQLWRRLVSFAPWIAGARP
jgi:hypothetical protein